MTLLRTKSRILKKSSISSEASKLYDEKTPELPKGVSITV